MTQTETYMASKPRYEILDGLRGVAAMIVVAFHLFETYSHGPMSQILNHGYLAVDFFFVLSGFVIGYAYDDRWDRMSLWGFAKRRLVRLHPMVIFGTLFGTLLFFFGDCESFSLVSKTEWWMVLGIMILGCLMIPVSTSMDIRGWGETYPLNGPSWSLMWEYLANILYALFVRHFSKTLLAIFVLCSAFLTIDITMNLNIFGLLPDRGEAAHTLIGGWSLDSDQLYIGITRLLYPFFAGVLLSRMGSLIKLHGGFWWCALIITILLVTPRLGDADNQWINGLYEAISVIVLFPLIVAMGAGSNVTGKRSIAICTFMGEISFPLYITHFPLIYMQMAWMQKHPDMPLGAHIMVSVSIYILAIAVAYGALKLYDIPVRAWLKEHFLIKKTNKPLS